MSYFGLQYQVLFHDTMAYGSHHYMTNFKFQNYARETLLFETQVNGKNVWQEELKDLVLLTREAYTLNMGPVVLGEKVGILMTYEAPTRSTVRLCFRIVRQDGMPVSCGYQTMVYMNKNTLELEPAPAMVSQYLDSTNEYCVLEELKDPSFAERLKKGGNVASQLFPEDIIALGKMLANAPRKLSYPRIIDKQYREYDLGESASMPEQEKQEAKQQGKVRKSKTVLTFPGQGSYHYAILRELYTQHPDTAPFFNKANELTTRRFGKPFLPLVEAASQQEHDVYLSGFRDLDQVGIYLTEVLIAGKLLKAGLKPDLLLGHSFGEIAALAVAGVYSIAAGLEIICDRVSALQIVPAGGKMAAVSCDVHTAAALIRESGLSSLQIAVVNYPRQTVVSGREEELAIWVNALPSRGISVSMLKSNYPFHSHLLKDAVSHFKHSLSRYTFKPAQIPVYHCTENRLYHAASDLPEILATQFIKPLKFNRIVDILYEHNFKNYIESGAGDIVTKIIAKNLKDKTDFIALPAALPGEGLSKGIDHIVRIGAEKSWLYRNPASETEAPAYPEGQAENPVDMPIAIVAMGCVLPGAKNPEEYWDNIVHGKSGIVDLASLDANAATDFIAGHARGMDIEIIPDKTYSLLNGTILELPYDPDSLGSYYQEEAFHQLTRGQRMLALALAQSFKNKEQELQAADKIQCILGATADGTGEYDEAIFVEGVLQVLDQLEETAATKQAFRSMLKEISGYQKGDAASLEQSRLYKEVVSRFMRKPIKTYLVDTACSSSLYAVDFGVKALRNHEADIILAGGVFAPGPSNNTLFAQFRGLSPRRSAPLDQEADGVIFADGATILVLKRLSDAIQSQDPIVAVIRGLGLSSDGKTPSINVPKPEGQQLAMERALRKAHISVDSIQYMEMHATATPVGDSVEFNAIKALMKDRNPDVPPVVLGSVKALIGHTGWVSGIASIIKICKGFEHRLMPMQYNFTTPNPEMDFEGAHLHIPIRSQQWEHNIDHLPLRAGVNGFGFGGTNAHVVLEAFEPDYHAGLIKNLNPAAKAHTPLAMVGIGNLFPGTDHFEEDQPTKQVKFDRKQLRLPAKKLLLPDVTESMDASQFLGPLAAEKIFEALGDHWPKYRQEIGVVFGLTSKTESGIKANERILADRFVRQVTEYVAQKDSEAAPWINIARKISNHFKENNLVSGPYTLPGLMPNVAPSRITSLYNLNGPNIVIDAGDHSLLQALLVAEQLLMHDDCKIVLAGGISSYSGMEQGNAEAACIYALTTREFAEHEGFNMISHLEITTEDIQEETIKIVQGKLNYRGATGGIAILQAISQQSAIMIEANDAHIHEKLVFGNSAKKVPVTNKPTGLLPDEIPATHAYVRGTPIGYYEPSLFGAPPRDETFSLKGKYILFLTDQPDAWKLLEDKGVLSPLRYGVATPHASSLANAVHLEVSSDAKARASLAMLAQENFDVVIGVKFLGKYQADSLLNHDFREESQFVDLLFATARHYYQSLYEKKIAMATLCMSAWRDKTLDPYTGLVHGFMKSLAREIAAANISMVNTDENNFFKAIRQLEIELGQTKKDGEVSYRNGHRLIFKLTPIQQLARDNRPCVNSNAVVIATGGGRGVTAVLAEELLKNHGCTVIGVGRTHPDDAPFHVLQMDEMAFLKNEAQFYQDEIARDNKQKIVDLKKKFQKYQAANEVYQVMQRLHQLPGKFIYKSIDLNDEQAVDALVRSVYEEFGRVDMVLHGAGIQKSGMLTNKPLEVFRQVLATKVASLGYLYRAINKHNASHVPVHYHMLTSTFSVLGNDGQPDYGAANEAMNRIAANMSIVQPGIYWSSLAWLGWAGIGMTRSTEYAALAASRRLRGVTKEEGQQIFAGFMKGKPSAPVNVLMADGEFDYYGFPKAEQKEKWDFDIYIPGKSRKNEIVERRHITIDNTQFLLHHIVDGIPTMPGALMSCMAAEVATALRPDLMINVFQNTHSYRFVRVKREQGIEIRIKAEVIEEQEDFTIIKTQMLSDFVHQSGRVLQKDILHNETKVKMSRTLATPPALQDIVLKEYVSLPDPYCLNEVVRLRGQFDSMYNIRVGHKHRTAEYKLKAFDFIGCENNYLIPNMMLMDAFWRFGTIQLVGKNKLAVFVPEKCRSMEVYYDFRDFENPLLLDHFVFTGPNPVPVGQNLKVGPLVARNASGEVMLIGKGGFARNFGEVQYSVAEDVLR